MGRGIARGIPLPFPIDSSQESTKKKQIWAQFGQRRTHNEQIIVMPCGIIIAQETFYGAEGVGSVVVRDQIFS